MDIKLLHRILEAPSPSGFETGAQAIIREELDKVCESTRSDVLGNVMGTRNKEGNPVVMLTGHSDEIGLQITSVNEHGYLRFRPIGSVDPYVLLAERVKIHTDGEPVLGVIGRTPIHELRENNEQSEIDFTDLWIDIGVHDREEALNLVSIGDPVTYASNFEKLRGDFIVSKSVDNKLGSFMGIEVMKHFAKHQDPEAAIHVVSTVQEELGARGATVASHRIKPDIMIALTEAWDTIVPGMDSEKLGPTECGKGPIILRGANMNSKLYDLFMEVAYAESIPVQIQGEPGRTGTDAWPVQISRDGVTTGLINIPMRYCHTSSEIINLKDVESGIKLAIEVIKKLHGDLSFKPLE